MTYNGWSNYETWAVKLWIDNEEGSYRYWVERARQAWIDAEPPGDRADLSREERATCSLMDELKADHEENTPTVTGIYSDLLNAALSDVNWHEIAATMVEDGDG